jgi:pimeloyl-ACP methyl ester carboxylesterase
MSLRRCLIVCGLLTAYGALPGCLVKIALDAPSEPLEKLASNSDRLARSAEHTASAVETASHEITANGRPDLNGIYRHVAKVADKDRNPVIVIPGILGSRLVDDASGQVVWGEFGGHGIDPEEPADARLFAIPMEPGKPLGDIKTTVRPDGALSTVKVNLLGLPIQIAAYRDILQALGAGGYSDPDAEPRGEPPVDGHFTCFQFSYDWRRDNAENARRLHEFILEKKSYVERERINRYGTSGPVRFDVVAHSMGALLARYYLMYGPAELPSNGTPPVLTWAGAQHIDRLVQVGPPNAGAAKALYELVHGVRFSKLLPEYDAALWGTMPAAYQLLPRTRHRVVRTGTSAQTVDVLDPKVWEQNQWGLLDPKQDGVLKKLLPGVPDPQQRRRVAADHLQKCLRLAEAFQAAVDLPAAPPKGTTIHLIAGDAHPTMSQLKTQPGGSVEVVEHAPGDGTVTRASALMDERLADGAPFSPRLASPITFQSVTFLLTDHRGLTSDPSFADNVLFLLLEAPR